MPSLSTNLSKKNPMDWHNEKFVICDVKLAVSLQERSKIATWYSFIVQKEHLFLRNIYFEENLEKSENISSLENYCNAFDYFLHVAVLLNKSYNKNCNVEDVDLNVMATFLDR